MHYYLLEQSVLDRIYNTNFTAMITNNESLSWWFTLNQTRRYHARSYGNYEEFKMKISGANIDSLH